ncbi:F-box/LRR-repeat protein 4 [Camellia lanceoleosa]|nr:F-box/LRR-repeat protein 4 [Camellia lanceoleosa]
MAHHTAPPSKSAPLTDALVQMLARRFVNIKNVFTDERLSISLPVQFRKHGDAGLTALGEGFTKLNKLSLLWCSNVTSAGLKSIAEKCCSLRSLDLQDCYVGDQGAPVVGKCCRQLEDLNLQFCKGLTGTGLIVLAIGCGKTLKYVGVAACAELTYISLEAIGSHCRSLEKLSLNLEFINNKGILVVAKGCHLLKVLKLQCINVTDEALQAVGIFCLSLELLDLYSFPRFTGKSLCAIGEGCKKPKKILL